jgi:hypothetical protein
MDDSADFTSGREFHLREYDSLRQEIAGHIEHTRKLEIYAVGALAAFYSWFLAAPKRPAVILMIPIVLSVLAALRSYSTLSRIYEIAAYQQRIENAFALKRRGVMGWETYQFKPIAASWTKIPSPLRSTAAIFWFVLIASSIAAWWLPLLNRQ